MSGRGSGRMAARLLCAAAAPLRCRRARAFARPPPPPPPPDAAELDPSAPLAPMPDLGVEWPDLKAADSAAPPPAIARQPARSRPSARRATTGDIRYTVQVEGLGPIGNAEDLLRAFRKQSALEAERKDPANAAQIGRRAERRRRPPRPNCCAARAIMMRRSSRGPKRPATTLRVVLDRRSRPAISLRLGRAARARGGRPGGGQAARRRSRSRRAIR